MYMGECVGLNVCASMCARVSQGAWMLLVRRGGGEGGVVVTGERLNSGII